MPRVDSSSGHRLGAVESHPASSWPLVGLVSHHEALRSREKGAHLWPSQGASKFRSSSSSDDVRRDVVQVRNCVRLHHHKQECAPMAHSGFKSTNSQTKLDQSNKVEECRCPMSSTTLRNFFQKPSFLSSTLHSVHLTFCLGRGTGTERGGRLLS
jgi:hypothetical protein